jgi:hypothetical protein
MIQIKKPSDFPNGPFWVMVQFSSDSYTVPGDERSRTNPGHGYPEHTVTTDKVEMTAFTSESEWKKVVGEAYLENQKGGYRSKLVAAFHVDSLAKLSVTTNINVE